MRNKRCNIDYGYYYHLDDGGDKRARTLTSASWRDCGALAGSGMTMAAVAAFPTLSAANVWRIPHARLKEPSPPSRPSRVHGQPSRCAATGWKDAGSGAEPPGERSAGGDSTRGSWSSARFRFTAPFSASVGVLIDVGVEGNASVVDRASGPNEAPVTPPNAEAAGLAPPAIVVFSIERTRARMSH